MAIFRAGLVGVCEFRVAHTTSLAAIGFLEYLIGFLSSKVEDVLYNICLGNLFQEIVGDITFAAELTGLSRELFLRLTCEGRIDDETIDEDEDMIPNLVCLQGCATLVLFLDDFSKLITDLVGDVVDVRTP